MFETVTTVLELIYYASGALVAVAAILGLRQIGILKKDIRIRNERAAKEKAIEFSSRYLTSYVELDGKWTEKKSANKIPRYNGPVGNFSPSSIPGSLRDIAAKRFQCTEWLPAMNELSAIASAFVHGVADEGVGFEIIGRTFCSSVESDYDILAIARSEPVHSYYESVVRLYETWKPRLNSAELHHVQDMVGRALANTISTKIDPIGTK
jgi:hypothetical protein